jgi:AraC family transcriptional regulator of adaptative response/methylated-DNA-[protein]-cysteine methyltransferase
VASHADPAAAEAAGFRVCLRCQPKGPSKGGSARRRWLLLQRRAARSTRPRRPQAWPRSPRRCTFHCHRLCKRLTGVTPNAYAAEAGAARAHTVFTQEGSVSGALHTAGYSSSRFYAKADGQLGMQPGRYRAGGRGVTVRFAGAHLRRSRR